MPNMDFSLRAGLTDGIFDHLKGIMDETCTKTIMELGERGGQHPDQYRTFADFLFCSLFPDYREACQQFYQGDGKLLCEILKPDDIEHAEGILMLTVAIVERFKKNKTRKRSWRALVRELQRLLRNP